MLSFDLETKKIQGAVSLLPTLGLEEKNMCVLLPRTQLGGLAGGWEGGCPLAIKEMMVKSLLIK